LLLQYAKMMLRARQIFVGCNCVVETALREVPLRMSSQISDVSWSTDICPKAGGREMLTVALHAEKARKSESPNKMAGSKGFAVGKLFTKMLLIWIISALILVLGASFSNPVLAEEPTFAKLQAMCRDRKDELRHGFCIGFLEAIALRVANENKHCTLLQRYIDSPNANLAFSDLIADLDPQEYSGSALTSVEKFFLNRGCN
jgi:hypothetical protein